jgi:hypothetical protein
MNALQQAVHRSRQRIDHAMFRAGLRQVIKVAIPDLDARDHVCL